MAKELKAYREEEEENEFDQDYVRMLILDKTTSYEFSTNFLAEKIIKGGDLQIYIDQRFYNITGCEFNFWILLYKGYVDLAIQFYENEASQLNRFINEFTSDGKRIKIRLRPDDPNLMKIVQELEGLKWGMKEAMTLGLDEFATHMIKKHKAIQMDQALMI